MGRSARWWAPGRLNLIGDHTDYQLGWVLPLAIDRGLTVTVDLNDTSRLEVCSHQLGTVVRELADLADGPRGWSAYVEGAVQLLRGQGLSIGGARIAIDSTLPVGGGQASSAALTCGTLAALTEAAGGAVDAGEVAAMAQRVENDYVGAGVGYMDPAAVMFGRAGSALLIDTRTRSFEPVPCDWVADGVAVLVVDTLEHHLTSGREYADRVAQCRAAATQLSVGSLREITEVAAVESIDDPTVRARARHVVTENRRVLAVADLLRGGRIRDIGEHLVASHCSLRDDFGVSTVRLDAVVDVALASGAMGARMTGAGFGGSALVLVDASAAGEVVREVRSTFSRRGWGSPLVDAVSAARGAHSVRR